MPRNDPAHEETDQLIREMEKKVSREYANAVSDMESKLDKYLKNFEVEDVQKKAEVAAGTLSQEKYLDWRRDQMLVSDQWQRMKGVLSQDLHNANRIARSIVNGYMPDAYAINFNYGTFQVEKLAKVNTSFTLYDRHTVERLLRDDPQILQPPGKKMQETFGKFDAYKSGKPVELKSKTKSAFDKLIRENRDIRWQAGKLQSVTLQSVLQGESIPHMAKRIANTMGEINKNASIRYARTAMTEAQNAGRVNSYQRAKDMGIGVKQQWMAIHDAHTRDSHAVLDGEIQEVGKKFSNACRYPGDPAGKPEEIWNCRCTLVPYLDKYDFGDSLAYDGKINDMTYEEWKEAHSKKSDMNVDAIQIPHSRLHPENSYATNYFKGVVDEDNNYRDLIRDKEYEIEDVVIKDLYTDQENNKVEDIRRMLGLDIDEPVTVVYADGKYILLDGNTRSAAALLRGEETVQAKVYRLDELKPNHVIAEGKDISNTWQRRSNQFDFEIEDVINAQGFDGLPRVVSKEEFDAAVKAANNGNGFIAQRTYSAPDKETLDAYRDQLYKGKWYVDCSNGTAAYGQGMYSSADFDGNLSKSTQDSMKFYQNVSEGKGNPVSTIETFTLVPDAKIANYDEINKEFSEYKFEKQKLINEERNKMQEEARNDLLHRIIMQDSNLKDNENSALYFIESQLGVIESDWDKMSEAASLLGKEGRSSAKEAISKFNLTKNEYEQKYIEDNLKTDFTSDVGAYAALKGYDAIQVGRGVNGSNECIILNRTKCIFRKE